MKRIFLYIVSCSWFFGCVEAFDPVDIVDVLDGALVVDARLHDGAMEQDIFLTRTFNLSDSGPLPETGALVKLMPSDGATIEFAEQENGRYTSVVPLDLQSGKSYQLQIITKDGVQYLSDSTIMPPKAPMNGIRAERRLNGFETDGVAILVDTEVPLDGQAYFRFEFEETYRIIAPDPNPFDWDQIDYDINDGDGWEVTVAPRNGLVHICYGNNSSNSIVLASTEGLTTNTLKDFQVRFIASTNYALSHRYSILVRQYHHDGNAASFFGSLQDFSSVESVFSNVQTGRLEGNIRVQNSSVAQVFGYFELSSVSVKRLFFNHDDIFPGEEKPEYLINCSTGLPPLYPEGFHITPAPSGDGFVVDGNGNSPLIEGILAGLYAYHAENEDYEEWLQTEGLGGAAPFLVKPKGCVDCTVFGGTQPPEFWIEE
ncbi:Hypothetical protein I595_492 [Croceitalea dokdonensis DOKDO 023]|uniref:Lipoprotein n=1 Tax=Croceitalea dokdonensis DOKDO 023 TaxID=1300341 RepID=A0A0P7AZB3_9FLAO|nr:DUF4249 domain-containing protein [Croceitalea dokdonensis]KPM33589.1 Hypothetical protein I595_492 [Croceitalea dokdonensis DOKDO 023]